MKDLVGNKLNIGDKVIHPSGNIFGLLISLITGTYNDFVYVYNDVRGEAFTLARDQVYLIEAAEQPDPLGR